MFICTVSKKIKSQINSQGNICAVTRDAGRAKPPKDLLCGNFIFQEQNICKICVRYECL